MIKNLKMKTPLHVGIIFRMVSSMLLVIFVGVQLSGCGPDGSDPASKQAMANLTAGPWGVTSVTVDGVDQSALFNGFTITFLSNAYTTTNGGPVWPASGAWNFTDEKGTKMERDGALEIELQVLTETSLKMSLHWAADTFGEGRMNSIQGDHVFVMER
jgi:hypothetical protein